MNIKAIIFSATTLLSLLGIPAAASASVTYEYQGNNFTSFAYASGQDPYSPNLFSVDDSLRVSLNFSSLPSVPYSGWFFQFGSAPGWQTDLLLDWEVKAGPVVLSSQSHTGDMWGWLQLSDAGQLQGWSITAYTMSSGLPYNEGTIFSNYDSYVHTGGWVGGEQVWEYAASCLGNLDCLAQFGYPFAEVQLPGAWSVSTPGNIGPIPEPEVYCMMAGGLALLALRRRRKTVNS